MFLKPAVLLVVCAGVCLLFYFRVELLGFRSRFAVQFWDVFHVQQMTCSALSLNISGSVCKNVLLTDRSVLYHNAPLHSPSLSHSLCLALFKTLFFTHALSFSLFCSLNMSLFLSVGLTLILSLSLCPSLLLPLVSLSLSLSPSRFFWFINSKPPQGAMGKSSARPHVGHQH